MIHIQTHVETEDISDKIIIMIIKYVCVDVENLLHVVRSVFYTVGSHKKREYHFYRITSNQFFNLKLFSE